MNQEQNLQPDWDDVRKPASVFRSAVRVVAALLGISLIIGVVIFAFFIIACSQLGGGTRTVYGLGVTDALRALLMLVPASVLGLLLVEFGATARTSAFRTWTGAIALLALICIAFFGLPHGLR